MTNGSGGEMRIMISFYGPYRHVVGTNEIQLTFAEASLALNELLKRICQRWPGLGIAVEKVIEYESVTVIVNGQFAESTMLLKDGDEIQIFPPLHGG